MEVKGINTKFSVGDEVFVVDRKDYIVVKGEIRRIKLELGTDNCLVDEEYEIVTLSADRISAKANSIFTTATEAFEVAEELSGE